MRTRWRSSFAVAALWCWTLHAQTPQTPSGPAPLPPRSPGTAPPAPAPAPEAAPADQGPDTLPPLDASGEPPTQIDAHPEPSTARASAPAVVVKPQRRSAQPVRAERRLAILGEVGWNSLAGFGPDLTFHVLPEFSIDLGAGLSLVGWKIGLRTRYNFLESPVTPFIGVGLLGASGFDTPSQNITANDSNSELNVKIHPSAFLQSVVGIDWTSPGGFTMVSALGYAWLLTGDNVEVVTGTPTRDERRAFDVIFRSSVVVSFAFGYSFR